MKTKIQFVIMTLLVLISAYTFSQGGALGNFRPLVGALPLGWTAGTPGDLQIRNDFAGQPIRFFTGGATLLNQRMIINGSGGPTAGFVGIGNGLNPLYRLDVDNDININWQNIGNGYRMNGVTILQTPNFGGNTYVGPFAGLNTVPPLAIGNTFVGNNAGRGNTSGNRNTCVGSNAGLNSTTGSFNTYIGTDAGRSSLGSSNTFVGEHSGSFFVTGNGNSFFGSHSGIGTGTSSGNDNTFIGLLAGPNIFNTDRNTFVGSRAGTSCNTGSENSFLGFQSGQNTQSGQNNVFIGFRAGRFNQQGDSNVAIGSLAGPPFGFTNLINAIAIGANARVLTNQTMILGNNRVSVGIGLSGAPGGPQNKLEINSDPNSFAYTGTGSGLRFRQLTTAGPFAAPNGFALTVDANGDVILVPIGANPFALCTPGPLPPIAGSMGADLNNFNFYFADGPVITQTTNNVGIGYNCGALVAKLDVVQNAGNLGNSIAVKGLVPFQAPGGSAPNVAGWFEAASGALSTSYAVFSPPGGGIVSIGYPFGTFVAGAILQVAGNIDANGNFYPSDSRYKTNLSTVTGALDKISGINPVYFYYDTLTYGVHNFESDKQIGFIAQNVDSFLPEVVTINDSGFYSLEYSKMVPLLLQGIKELKQIVDSLQQNSQRTGNTSNVLTVDLASDIILYQNYPNPFGNETIIKYYLPSTANAAKMLFMDETGRLIKEVDLATTGDGQLTVNAQDLASGIYTYSLQVNGQTIQTRKMQKVN
ncbi:MAG: tail fiber domain-containing protein [Bacteroidota bacterium]